MSDCSSHGDHKPHLETEKSVEFVEVEYGDLKGFCVDLKLLVTDLIYFAPSSCRVDEMAIEIDNLVRHG